MKLTLEKMCFSFTTGFIKFLIIYYIFGITALYATGISLGITHFLETGSLYMLTILQSESGDVYSFLAFLIEGIISSVPFSDFLNLLLDSDAGSIFGSLADIFIGFIDPQTRLSAWNEYSDLLFKDMVISALSALIFFFFTRFKKSMGLLKGFSVELAWAIVSVFWLFASYCVSKCVMAISDSVFSSQPASLRYFVIFAIAILLHAVFLGVSFTERKFLFLRSLIALLADVLFSLLTSILLWLLGPYLYNMLNLTNAVSSIFAFIFISLIVKVLDNAKTIVVNKITFPFFMFFQKLKTPF